MYYFNHNQWVDKADQTKPVKVLQTSVAGVGELDKPDMQAYLEERGKTLEAQQKLKAEEAQQKENSEENPEEDSSK